MPEIHVVGSMIVKNEAENLPALFASAQGVVDAWVIVDTGSTDETISGASRSRSTSSKTRGTTTSPAAETSDLMRLMRLLSLRGGATRGS